MERTGKAVESSKMYEARERHTNLYLLNMNICEVIIVCLKGILIGSLKAGSHIIAAIVSIAAVSSKSGLTIGPII